MVFALVSGALVRPSLGSRGPRAPPAVTYAPAGVVRPARAVSVAEVAVDCGGGASAFRTLADSAHAVIL